MTLPSRASTLTAWLGLTEPDWVVLNLAASGSPDLRARVSEVFHVPERVAAQRIDGLVGRGLLDAATLGATPAGRETFRRVTAGIDDVTRRAWGDVDAAELEVAARVLSTVLTRAQSMLSTVPAVAAT